jgi:DNA-binding response OmpR family regulator
MGTDQTSMTGDCDPSDFGSVPTQAAGFIDECEAMILGNAGLHESQPNPPTFVQNIYHERLSGENTMAIYVGQLEIPEDEYRVKVNGRSISLTTAEYRVLWKLATHLDAVVNYSLLDRQDGPERHGNRRAVQAVVASLRRKLSRFGCKIRTARDMGYALMR